jgi:cellulose biosynthesis protein BcsQ
MGYKTVLIDADPQCNLSRLALGEKFYTGSILQENQNIYGVLRGIIE